MTTTSQQLDTFPTPRSRLLDVVALRETLTKEFVYGGHMMALGAVSGGVIALMATGQPVAWSAALMIYLTFEPIYIFDRWRGYRQDCSENPERSAYLGRYLHWMPALIAAYIIVLVTVGLLSGSPAGLLVCGVLLVMGLAYGDVFKPLTRHLPLFKNLYVALFWMTAGGFIVLTSSHTLSVGAGLILAFVFLLSVKIQAFFDFKDVQADTEAGLKTLPALVGDAWARRLLMLLAGAMLLPVLVGVGGGVLEPPVLAVAVALPLNLHLLHEARYGLRRAHLIKMGAEYLLVLAVLVLATTISGLAL